MERDREKGVERERERSWLGHYMFVGPEAGVEMRLPAGLERTRLASSCSCLPLLLFLLLSFLFLFLFISFSAVV